MAAKDLSPEKMRLVSALQGRKKDTYCDKTLHRTKHAKRKQSNWLFDQAVDKCGGAGADGAERRAAALIYGACDLQKVASDPAVKALVWSANEKVQATVVTSIHKYFQDPDRSLAAKVFSDASNVGWDQLRKVQAYKADAETGTPVRMVLSDVNPALSETIEMPCMQSARSVARRRKAIAKDLGSCSLETDGSSHQVQTLTNAMKRAMKRKGRARAETEVNEMVVGGDAVQSMKSGRVNATNMSLKATGSHGLANSPKALFALLHWQGDDHYANLNRQCSRIVAEIHECIAHGGITVTDSSDEDDDYFAACEYYLSADGAMIAAEEGACSFQGLYPCPWCMCPKDSLSSNFAYPKKTYAYLCNASHMPDRIAGPSAPFKAFSCPIPTCRKRFGTQEAVDNESELEGQAGKDFRRTHDQCHKLAPIFPFQPCWQIIPCTLHYLLGCTKHIWSVGIAHYISSDAVGKAVTDALRVKCGVCLDVQKVSNGNHAKAARMVSIGGAQARSVVAHFELFAKVVFGWPADFDKEHPPLEVPDLDKPGEMKRVTKHDLETFKKIARVGDALLVLWNCISERMHGRFDANKNRMPSTTAERNKKADQLQRCERMYRIAYEVAFGKTAFKPYTHIGSHLHHFQRYLQYDLKDYSSEAQEHQGKMVKTVIRTHTNKRLTKPDKLGRVAASYLEQASDALQAKLHVEEKYTYIVAQSYAVKKRRKRDEVQTRVVKKEVWDVNVYDSSQAETCGGEEKKFYTV